MISLKTENYMIKLIENDDLPFYLSLYENSALMKYIGQFETKKIIKNFKKTIELNQSPSFKSLTFCIFHLEQPVGILSLVLSKEQKNHCEIGAIIIRHFKLKDLIFEVAAKMIEYCFENLDINRVYANYSSKNIAVSKLVKKLSFTIDPKVDGFHYAYICKTK